MSKSGMTEKPNQLKPDPWRVPVATAQVPDTGLHRDIEADQAIRHAMADVGGLREVLSAQASFDVTPNERRPLPCQRAMCGRGSGRPAW